MTSPSLMPAPASRHLRQGIASRIAVGALAAGAGLVVADAAIVVLALPDLVPALDTSVEGVAAVVAVYTAMVAVAAPAAVPVMARLSVRGAAVAGAVAFAAGSFAGATATGLPAMLLARAVQGGGGGLLLVASFEVLRTRPGGRDAWRLASMAGLVTGPAMGGALTQAFGWRAIFAVGVPVALAAAIGATVMEHRGPVGGPSAPQADVSARRRAYASLALLSAALVAVLFVVVLMLITGWGLEPVAAAALMTVLPVAALVARRVRWPAGIQVAAGAALVAGGIAALAVLRGAPLAGVAGPLALAGFGLGLAGPALEDRLLGQHAAPDVARIAAVRHAAVTIALLVLAPLVAAQLERTTETARELQLAALLDSDVPPLEKLRLLPALTRAGEHANLRDGLRETFDEAARTTADAHAVRTLRQRSDAVLVEAVHDTVQTPLLILAGTALAVVLVVPRTRAADFRLATAVLLSAAVVAGTASAPTSWKGPDPLPGPCRSQRPPTGSGLDHAVQRVVLGELSRTACAVGATREELVLATASEGRSAAFRRRHGVDPRRALDRVLGVLSRLDPVALLGLPRGAP